MISYPVYKFIHLLAVVIFFSGAAISLYSNAQKHVKIISGVASLLIMVAGMGLMARIGIDHSGGFPFWLSAKMAIWLALTILVPVAAKRAPEKFKKPLFGLCLVLFFFAHYLAFYKPV